MSEACARQAGGGHRDIPRFVVGCEDDEQDVGQMQAGMKNEMFRENKMEEDDDDESVSNRCWSL